MQRERRDYHRYIGQADRTISIGQNGKVFSAFQKSGRSMSSTAWYQAYNPEVAKGALSAAPNSLKSQMEQNVKSPFSKARAITKKLCASNPAAVENDPLAKPLPDAKSP
jgi:hypothetical protein